LEGDFPKEASRNFELKVMEMAGNVNDFVRTIRSDMESSDVVMFLPDKDIENSLQTMSEFCDKFYVLKDYSDEFPMYTYLDESNEISKRDTNLHDVSKHITMVDNVSDFCGQVTQDLYVEKKKEKGISESLAHKVGRKSDLIRACCASVFVSAMVSLIVAIPGLIILLRHQDLVSIIFSIIFVVLGVCEMIVGFYLCFLFLSYVVCRRENCFS